MGEYSPNVNKFLWNSTGMFQTVDSAASSKGRQSFSMGLSRNLWLSTSRPWQKAIDLDFQRSRVEISDWCICGICISICAGESSREKGVWCLSLFKGNFRTQALNVRGWKWGNTNPKYSNIQTFTIYGIQFWRLDIWLIIFQFCCL